MFWSFLVISHRLAIFLNMVLIWHLAIQPICQFPCGFISS